MYIPSSYAERDLPTLFEFIEAHPLAALVTSTPAEGLFATHLPLVLDRTTGPLGTLVGHFARANPHYRCVTGGAVEALMIFTGPEAYITPQWYPTKRETGRVVPTWNYVAVHAYGTLRPRDDPQFLRAHLEALTLQHEGARPRPWHVSDAPPDYIAQQMKAIVAVELTIDRLEGKWKMSQNRPPADIDGVVDGLGESTSHADRTVAAIVEQRRPSKS
jgi:transcriptional regulator